MSRLPLTNPVAIAREYQVDDGSNTLLKVNNGVSIEVGLKEDIGSVHPHVKLCRQLPGERQDSWIAISLDSPTSRRDVVQYDGGSLLWGNGSQQARLVDTVMGGLPEFRLDAILLDRPLTDVVRFKLEYSNCSFHYQGQLTPEQIRAGRNRPDRVVGSYAVRRSDGKKNNMYQTGKVFHLFRPLVTDWAGQSIYADIRLEKIDDNSSWLDVIIDPVWLSHATYPVVVDPDIGYTTIGASNSSIENTAYGYEFTMTEAGTLDSISAYCIENGSTGAHTTECAVYEADDTRLAVSAQKNDWVNATAAWGTHTVSGSPSLSNAATYRALCGSSGGGSTLSLYYDDNISAQNPALISYTLGSYPDPGTAVSTTTEDYSVYVTYTAGGGGGNGEDGMYYYMMNQ